MHGMAGNDHVVTAKTHLDELGKFVSTEQAQITLASATANATLGLAYEQRTTAMVEAAAVLGEYDPEFGAELRKQIKKRLGYESND